MDEIRVTFGEIAAGQQSVTGTSQQIAQQLDDLKAFLAPMVSEWTGEAAQNYQVQQNEIDSAWRDLNQVLAQIGVLLGQANDNYMATEQLNARRYA